MEQYLLMAFLNQFQLDCYCRGHEAPKYEELLVQKLKTGIDSVSYKILLELDCLLRNHPITNL